MLCSISVCRDGQVTCDNSSCVSTCQWSAWSLWSPCGVTCGLGLQQRYRSVILNIFDSQLRNWIGFFYCLNFVSSLFQSACFYCDLLFWWMFSSIFCWRHHRWFYYRSPVNPVVRHQPCPGDSSEARRCFKPCTFGKWLQPRAVTLLIMVQCFLLLYFTIWISCFNAKHFTLYFVCLL